MVLNDETNQILVQKLKKADTFRKRFLGLMGQKTLTTGDGLLLIPCNGIHTFFMRFPIDVLYLNHYYQILDVYEEVKPWRALPFRKTAKYVLELPAGKILATGTKQGHRIVINGE